MLSATQLATARVRLIDLSTAPAATPVLGERALQVPIDHLPAIPPCWRPVYGGEVATAARRFGAFITPDGVGIGLHSTADAQPEPAGHLIALMNLGGHRVALHGDEYRFEARWARGWLAHRLTAEPTALGAFMELVLNLAWG